MSPFELILWGAALTCGWMVLAWVFAFSRNNAAWVDVAWTFAFSMVSAFFCVMGQAPFVRKTLLALMVGVWSLRLGIYLLRRVASHPEDPRYGQMRSLLPGRPWLLFFFVFQLQGLLVGVLSIPFGLMASHTARELSVWEVAGLALWLVGLCGEAVADAQLVKFKKNPENAGRVCRSGLWRYSRHPNYFFEWVVWVGFGTAALGSPNGWAGLIAPVVMFLLLTRVTGIPPAEAASLKSRGDAYRVYQRETSAFFPLPPRAG